VPVPEIAPLFSFYHSGEDNDVICRVNIRFTVYKMENATVSIPQDSNPCHFSWIFTLSGH